MLSRAAGRPLDLVDTLVDVQRLPLQLPRCQYVSAPTSPHLTVNTCCRRLGAGAGEHAGGHCQRPFLGALHIANRWIQSQPHSVAGKAIELVNTLVEMERSYLTADVFREILASTHAAPSIGSPSQNGPLQAAQVGGSGSVWGRVAAVSEGSLPLHTSRHQRSRGVPSSPNHSKAPRAALARWREAMLTPGCSLLQILAWGSPGGLSVDVTHAVMSS